MRKGDFQPIGERIRSSVRIDRASGCWVWQKSVHRGKGYGRIEAYGVNTTAHRAAYEAFVGPIRSDVVVRQTCGNRLCCNPAHLTLATPGERSRATISVPVMERIRRSIRVDPETGCWLWQKARIRFGHGAIKHAGKQRKAHRVAYEVFVGPIPRGKQVLHKCDVPACCNPDHLYVGTHADNMRDMRERGRAAKGASNHFSEGEYRGELNANAILTAAKVRKIRASKAPLKVIARRFGISVGAVSHVRARRTWRHVK